jgi:hypothetical protein
VGFNTETVGSITVPASSTTISTNSSTVSYSTTSNPAVSTAIPAGLNACLSGLTADVVYFITVANGSLQHIIVPLLFQPLPFLMVPRWFPLDPVILQMALLLS